MQIRLTLSVVLAGLGGCIAESSPDVDSAPEIEVAERASRCGPTGCTGNSPIIDHYGFWELNVNGRANAQHIELIGLSKDRRFYNVSVQNSRLIATYPPDPSWNLEGPALKDAILWIRFNDGTPYGKQYGIVISDTGTIEEIEGQAQPPIWRRVIHVSSIVSRLLSSRLSLPQIPIFEEPAEPVRQTLTTYVLDWSPIEKNPLPPGPMAAGMFDGEMPVLGANQVNVCPPPEYSYYDKTTGIPFDNVSTWDRTAKMNVYHSLLFEGDRFDVATRTVGQVAENDWFNIACGWHALAKLRLTRNTINTTPGDWRNVQAMLKMLSADYCGSGQAFTVDGEPLVWRDRALGNFAVTPKDLEARWDERGAVCLNTPRLEKNPLEPGIDRTIVEKNCNYAQHPLPLCNQVPVDSWEGNELVVSGNL